jgi:hypothetical protein
MVEVKWRGRRPPVSSVVAGTENFGALSTGAAVVHSGGSRPRFCRCPSVGELPFADIEAVYRDT